MADEVRIEGLGDVLTALQQLPKELVAKNGGVVNAALRKAATLIRNEARARSPVRTGALRNNIAIQRDRRPERSGAAERYRVGVRGGATATYANNKSNRRSGRAGKTYEKQSTTFYWRFLEFGTEKMRPQPFLVPAFESKKVEGLELIVDELERGIHKAAKKLAKGKIR